MNSKLVVFLCQVAHFQQKIEICKQIMAQNMNFSPAWFLALIQKSSVSQGYVSVNQLQILFQLIGAHFKTQQAVLIFDYLDSQKQQKIPNKIFVEALLPTQKNGLRKAAVKRIAEDLQLTSNLRYAMKRYFAEVLNSQSHLLSFEGAFDHSRLKHAEAENIIIDELKDFFKLYSKCLLQSQLSLIHHCIQSGRIKSIDPKLVIQLIRQDLKKSDHKKNQQKSNAVLPKMTKQNIIPGNIMPKENYPKTNQIEKGYKTAKSMAEKLLLEDQRKHLTETPIQKIREENQGIHFPKSYTLAKKSSDISEISLLQSVNDELNGQINLNRLQNSQKINNLQNQLTNLKSI